MSENEISECCQKNNDFAADFVMKISDMKNTNCIKQFEFYDWDWDFCDAVWKHKFWFSDVANTSSEFQSESEDHVNYYDWCDQIEIFSAMQERKHWCLM